MITAVQNVKFANSYNRVDYNKKQAFGEASDKSSSSLTAALIGLGIVGTSMVSCKDYDVREYQYINAPKDTTIVIGPNQYEAASVGDYLNSFGFFVNGNKSLDQVNTISMINSNGGRTYMQKVKADNSMAYFVCADVKGNKKDDYILAFVKHGKGIMVVKNDAQTGAIDYHQIDKDSIGNGYVVSKVLDNGVLKTSGSLEYKADLKQLTYYGLDGSIKSWKTTDNNEGVPVNPDLIIFAEAYKDEM